MAGVWIHRTNNIFGDIYSPSRFEFLKKTSTKLAFYFFCVITIVPWVLLVSNEEEWLRKRSVTCNETIFQHPIPTDDIPWNLFRKQNFYNIFFASFLWVVVIEGINYCKKLGAYKNLSNEDEDNLCSVRIVRFLSTYILGGLAVYNLCLALQLLVAQPKPYFLTATKSICCTTLNDTICAPQKDKTDMYLSFPSQYMALQSFNFFYMSVYVKENVGNKVLGSFLTLLHLIHLFSVWITLNVNHENNPFDITVGIAIGFNIALVSVCVIMKNFIKPNGEGEEEEDSEIPLVNFAPIEPPDYHTNDYPPSYESVVDECQEASSSATAHPEETPNIRSTNLPSGLDKLPELMPPPSYESVFDVRNETCNATASSGEDTQNIPPTNLPYEAPPRYQSIADLRQDKFDATTLPDEEEGCHHHQIEATPVTEEKLDQKIPPSVAAQQSVLNVNTKEYFVKFSAKNGI